MKQSWPGAAPVYVEAVRVWATLFRVAVDDGGGVLFLLLICLSGCPREGRARVGQVLCRTGPFALDIFFTGFPVVTLTSNSFLYPAVSHGLGCARRPFPF